MHFRNYNSGLFLTFLTLKNFSKVSSYGSREMTVFINHYGEEKASTYKSVTINQVGDIDDAAAIEE